MTGDLGVGIAKEFVAVYGTLCTGYFRSDLFLKEKLLALNKSLIVICILKILLI